MRPSRFAIELLAVVSVALVIACASPPEPPKETAPPPPPPPPPVQVAPHEPAIDGQDVEFKIISPKDRGKIARPGLVEVKFALKNWELDPTLKQKHLHFILDGAPYMRHDDSKAPFVFENVGEGHHTLFAFASRPWHESVKQPKAFSAVRFTVGKAEGKNPWDPKSPTLIYSRPKGEYTTEDAGKGILLDFYLANAELGPEGFKVRAAIDGTEFVMDRWAPYDIRNLQKGEHTVGLELLDATGQPVPGPFNRAEHKIVVKEAAPAPAPVEPAPSAATGPAGP